MKNLQLSLKNKWFEMTKSGEKTEDYREITPYWCSRLLLWNGFKVSQNHWYRRLEDFDNKTEAECLQYYLNNKDVTYKKFQFNIMTLGYPSASDWERITHLRHKGIEIRTGNPKWGAEPNKLYFVIKHGVQQVWRGQINFCLL